jgi:hypothetical protein
MVFALRTESHISVARTHVREGELARHAGGRWEGGRAFAVVSGLGLPRTWWIANGAVLRGLDRGLEESKVDRSGVERLVHACDRARAELAETCEGLVERSLPDAALAAVLFDQGEIHVVSAGPARVYLHRSGKPQRLTPREETSAGVLRARFSHCSAMLEPGDLVMAGSASAFSMKSIAQVVSVLQQDAKTPPSVLASLLTDPADQAGAGAAAIVMRVA